MVVSGQVDAKPNSVSSIDRSVVKLIERNPGAVWEAAAIVALAGAGRGITPAFEAGWAPVVGYSMAGFAIWLVSAGLIWNVAHRLFGYSAGLGEFVRVTGFAAAPLIGLWLNVFPFFAELRFFAVALHLMAFLALVTVTRAALSITTFRSFGICVLSLGTAIALTFLLGLLLVGTPAS